MKNAAVRPPRLILLRRFASVSLIPSVSRSASPLKAIRRRAISPRSSPFAYATQSRNYRLVGAERRGAACAEGGGFSRCLIRDKARVSFRKPETTRRGEVREATLARGSRGLAVAGMTRGLAAAKVAGPSWGLSYTAGPKARSFASEGFGERHTHQRINPHGSNVQPCPRGLWRPARRRGRT